ncbi:MAG TPA: flavin reductase family protein [Acidimicrobiales bacterium]|nr:flavin reductase family protein [Acidimicrobiales bacterium]
MDSLIFREAMSRFPSGVTIVTTVDDDGRWWGFTASSFCSASERPPLVLCCLATSAQCHAALATAASWTVQMIHHEQRHLARRFAEKRDDKFAGSGFVPGPGGAPVLPDSPVVLECRAHSHHDAGDHTILVGEVVNVQLGEREPLVYFRRAFHSIALPALQG